MANAFFERIPLLLMATIKTVLCNVFNVFINAAKTALGPQFQSVFSLI